MTSVKDIRPRDLEFLLRLQKKVLVVDKETRRPLRYNDDEIDESDVSRVLTYTERNGWIFAPANLNMGFSLGYQVINSTTLPNPHKKRLFERIRKNTCPDINLSPFRQFLTWNEVLLSVLERQLPEEYQKQKGFKRLSEYFMGEENLRRANDAGIEIVNRRSHYEY